VWSVSINSRYLEKEYESTFVKFTALEPTELPTFTTPLSNVMARVGQKLKLECDVTGIPRPDIIWQHNGKLFNNRDVKVSTIVQRAHQIDVRCKKCNILEQKFSEKKNANS
jgi:Immunoglobulin I-set domain